MLFSKSVLLTVVAIATLAVKAVPNPSQKGTSPVDINFEEEFDGEADDEDLIYEDDEYTSAYQNEGGYMYIPAPIAPVPTSTPKPTCAPTTPCAPCTPKTVTSVKEEWWGGGGLQKKKLALTRL